MSHFAKVYQGKVIKVIVADQAFVDQLVDHEPGAWIQTSYNTRGGKHLNAQKEEDGGTPLRYNYAGVGGNYDSYNDAFYDRQPYPSWKLNKTNYVWEAPKPRPADPDGKGHVWDEDIGDWKQLN